MRLAKPKDGQENRPDAAVPARRSRLASLSARVRQLVEAINRGDDKSVETAVRQLSQSNRMLAPLAFGVGALVMLFQGLKLVFTEWRLSWVQILPAMWIWAAMLDLKVHVLKGEAFHLSQGPFPGLAIAAIVVLTAAAFYLNCVFAFAISRPGRPQIRPAFSAVRPHLPVILSAGCVTGVALGFSVVVVPRWGLGWFVISLGIVIAVMMVMYIALPSRLVGIKSNASRRDKLAATVVGGVLGAVVCAPAYAIGRTGILLLGTHPLFVLGVILLSIGLLVQAGAIGAVKAVKMSAKLLGGTPLTVVDVGDRPPSPLTIPDAP